MEPWVKVSQVPEEHTPGEAPREYAQRLAQSKGRAVREGLTEAERASGPAWILAADTVVVRGAHLLEKPSDEQDARRILRALSGGNGTRSSRPSGSGASAERSSAWASA
jgi:septum formation protein